MTNQDAMLDALGEVIEQRKALEAKEKELRAALGSVFEKLDGEATVTTRHFVFKTRMNAGRRTLDTEALKDSGIDLEPFYKVGKPFMTLSAIRLS